MILFFWLLFSFNSDSISLQWPLKGPVVVSASFGEYRGSRFHMGLDLSTGGVEGRKVFPVSEGVIFKVRSSATGYGNSIYIQHPNGWISVYGHLAQFSPAIRNHLRQMGVQKEWEFGEVALHLKVDKETLIAWSGESGSGLPHLHFEVRDSKNRPLNPLELGLQLPSAYTEEPRLLAVRLIPSADDSILNGSRFPVEITDYSKPIQAKGPIRIEVMALCGTKEGNRLGLKSVSVFSGNTSSSWAPNCISYDDYHRGSDIFNTYFSGFGPTRYAYRMASPTTGGISGWETNGSNLVVNTPTIIRIVLVGLKKTRQWNLNLDPDALIQNLKPASFFKWPDVGKIWSGHFQLDEVEGDNEPRSLKPGFRLESPLLPEGVLNLVRCSGDSEQLVKLEEWSVSGNLGTLMVLEGHSPSLPGNELEPMSSILYFEDPGLPVRNMQLRWKPKTKDQPDHLGLFAWTPVKEKWLFEQAWTRDGKMVVDQCGVYAILRDKANPQISGLRSHSYFIGKKRVIPIKDKESGIDWDRVSLASQGKNFPVQIDRDRSWILVPDKLRAPFKVTVFDRCGNAASRSF